MTTVKTIVSLPQKTRARADIEAKNQNLSRNEFITKAIDDYLRRIDAKRIIEEYNRVYADGLDKEELETLRHLQRLSSKSIPRETEWSTD